MNELTSYKEFHELLRLGKTPSGLGFTKNTSAGDIIRFASRYKAAKSFQGIILEGFTSETTDGYAGLFKLMLCWSTFEQFLEIRGLEQRHTKELFDAYNAAMLCDEIRACDKGNVFYSFILSKVNNSHKLEIEKLFANQPLNSSYLASGIRHIFAHGYLSPHANGSQPKNVVKICNMISVFLLNIIDLEFSKQMNSYLILA
ncbi:hypothetical protein NIES4071_55360 [Calothrix sp. NIES-4071]|nr:hypothetical protein NIES4071_55360 [Calothrix sp. NIES-4071]BAZ59843.1 hypothetical protein NIES4105_55310 [Calothrix sp. NIES-4105]